MDPSCNLKFRTRVRLYSSALFVALTGTTPAISHAQVVPIAPKAGACAPAMVDETIEVASLQRFAAEASGDIKNVVAVMEATGGRRLPAAVRPKVINAIEQSFGAAALDEEFRRGVRSHCEPRVFAAALQQLKTPLGTKMRALEDFLLTAQGRNAFLSYTRNLRQHPAAPAREALLDRLESVLHTSDFMADVNAEEARATYIGISGKSASDAETQALREKMLPAMRQSVRTSALFVYRTASDDELELYIQMLDGVEMRSFNTILKSVIENGLIRRSQVAAAMIQQIAGEARTTAH